MKMTRQHFVVIAQAFGTTLAFEVSDEIVANALIERFADKIAHTNPNFKRDVFIQACTRAYEAGGKGRGFGSGYC